LRRGGEARKKAGLTGSGVRGGAKRGRTNFPEEKAVLRGSKKEMDWK